MFLLLVPHIKALALPTVVERATQKPHAEYDTIHQYTPLCLSVSDIHIHKASTAASSLTTVVNLRDSDVSRKSVSKRFSIKCKSIPTHMTHIGLLQAICNSKSIKKILIKQYVVSKKLSSPRYHNATVKMWRCGNLLLLCVRRHIGELSPMVTEGLKYSHAVGGK